MPMFKTTFFLLCEIHLLLGVLQENDKYTFVLIKSLYTNHIVSIDVSLSFFCNPAEKRLNGH